MDSQELLTNLRAARQTAVLHYPHYSPILTRVQLKLADGFSALACVDPSGRIYFNPSQTKDFLVEARPEHRLKSLAFVILHECLHLLRDHHDRSLFAPYPTWATDEAKRHHSWNIACDLEINAGFGSWIALLPSKWRPLLPEDFDILGVSLAEEYLSKISENLLGQIPYADEGSGVFASRKLVREWEVDSDPEEGKAIGWSPLDRTMIKHEVAAAILAGKRGSRSEVIWAQSVGTRKRDWKTILHSRINRLHSRHQQTGQARVDFRKPSRLQNVSRPLFIPNRRCHECFSITIVVDTSGSMNERLLQIALEEVERIARTMENCVVQVLQCDDEIVSYSNYRPSERHEIFGRGGTNMVHGVEVALQLQESPFLKEEGARYKIPAIVLVMTDGATPIPEQKYDTPVLWCIIDRENFTLPAPWTNRDLILIDKSSSEVPR